MMIKILLETFLGVYSTIMDQPGKVTNSSRGQPNRKNEYSSVPVRA